MSVQFLKNRIVRNASWLIGGRVVQMIISLIVGLLTARFLGPDYFGLINYGTAYTSFFLPFCTLGINSILVKELIDNKDSEGLVLGTSLVLRFLSTSISIMLIMLIVAYIDAGETTTQVVVFLCSLGSLFQIFEVYNYWFQSRLESKNTAIATLIAYFVTALYRLLLIFQRKPVTYFAIATSIDYLCLAVLLIFFYRKNKGQKLSFSKEYSQELIRRSYHFIFPSVMVAIYGQTDKLMLKHMISTAEIGYYSTAVSICSVWCFVLSAIIDSMYPSIMQAFKDKNIALFNRRNRQLYGIIFYISVAVSAFIAIFAPLIIHIMYGEAYAPAATPLRIVTWYTAFSYLGVARNAWIVSYNKQKYLKYVYLGAAISNVLLNLIFIPPLGASGAAIASLIAQIMTTMVMPFFIKPLRENSILMLKAIGMQDYRKRNKKITP